MAPQRTIRPVTNDVLLEKLNNQQEKIDKLDIKVTQNFTSLENILREAYINKDQFRPIEEWRKHMDDVVVPQIYAEISKRVHKDAAAPYLFAAKVLGGAGLLGAGSLIWKIITEYIRGGIPQ